MTHEENQKFSAYMVIGSIVLAGLLFAGAAFARCSTQCTTDILHPERPATCEETCD